MTNETETKNLVVVIGAGPAGLFAARYLALGGVEVILLNRDIKAGGLAEYGIYYDKFKMKDGLRKQFRQIMAIPEIHYYGNVTVGEHGDISLDEVRRLGAQAILVTVGAQGTKWLGLPGEELQGVYHAKDLVYHYNKLPPFSTEDFRIGKRVALIGVGNVMMDIAHWMIRDLKVDEVIAVARRGPAEVKFTKKEMETVGANLDVSALDAELARVRPIVEEIGQDIQSARDYILAALPKALEPISETRFLFYFLVSPTRILGNEKNEVCGLEVEDNKLVPSNGDTKARGLGTKHVLDVDTVIFCIGDRVDETFGLPVQWNAFIKNPEPRFPVGGNSYEAFDPQTNKPLENVFVAGWSREASSGLVGVARKDGENGAAAVLEYVKNLPSNVEPGTSLAQLDDLLKRSGNRVIRKEDVAHLEAFEAAEAKRMGLEEYKMKTNEEMLAAIAAA